MNRSFEEFEKKTFKIYKYFCIFAIMVVIGMIIMVVILKTKNQEEYDNFLQCLKSKNVYYNNTYTYDLVGKKCIVIFILVVMTLKFVLVHIVVIIKLVHVY